jgi:hypothetical protein
MLFLEIESNRVGTSDAAAEGLEKIEFRVTGQRLVSAQFGNDLSWPRR